MTNLATLVGYVIVEQRSDGTLRLASADVESDATLVREELAEWLRLEVECNGKSTYVLAEVHEVEEATP